MANESLEVFKSKVELTKKSFLISNPESEAHALKIFEREKGFAVMQVLNNAAILKCTPESFYTCISTVALTGISLNPALKLAYIVPRAGKAILDISYMGMIEILRNSGSVKDMRANCIFEGDVFEYSEGTGENYFIKHTPVLNRDHKLKIIAAYSIATLSDGSETFKLMDYNKLMQHKKVATTKAVWDSWEEEMMCKTVIRAHYKFLPKTEKATELMNLVDEANPVDFNNLNDIKDIESTDISDMDIAVQDLSHCKTQAEIDNVKKQFSHLKDDDNFKSAIVDAQQKLTL